MACVPGMPCYSITNVVFPKKCNNGWLDGLGLDTDLILYNGPNLPCTGINFKDTVTCVINKINDLLCPEALTSVILATIQTNTQFNQLFCELVNNCINPTTSTSTTSSTTTATPLPLRLTYLTIGDFPSFDVTNVTNWNTLFDLPANGNLFTFVEVIGAEIRLYGGNNIQLISIPFGDNDVLSSIIDEAECITSLTFGAFEFCYSLVTVNLPACLSNVGGSAFYDCSSLATLSLPAFENAGDQCFAGCSFLESFNLPSLLYAGQNAFDGTLASFYTLPLLATTDIRCFQNCTAMTNLYIPSCLVLGGADCTIDNFVFLNIASQYITLTVPTTLSICNAGGPDADIQYLQANNTVTLVTV